MTSDVSINIKQREEDRTGNVAAAWAIAVVNRLGRLFVGIFERLQTARGRGGERKQMKLVECLALGNRRQLLLVVCDSQRYLVAVGADSVGGILALESHAGPGTGAQLRTGPRSRPLGRKGKGPELVRHGVSGIASDTKATEAGAGVWQ